MIETVFVMLSIRTIKKISIIIGTVLIFLWFGGNLGLYLYLKYIFDDKTEKVLNIIPEKLKTKEAVVKAEALNFYKYKIKFPFYREDIRDVWPSYSEQGKHELENLMIVIDKGKGFISISKSHTWKDMKMSLWDSFIFRDNSYFGTISTIHYSKLKDFSWWNLLYNIGLSKRLKWKALLVSNFKVYDLETPYLKGFLSESKEEGNKWLTMLDFELKDELKNESYHIGCAGFGEEKLRRVRNILTTIKPINNIEKSYNEVKALYENNKKSKYPEELLLLSMMSIKGHTVDNLEELLKVMEAKSYSKYWLDDVKKELEYLKKQR